MSKAQLLTLCSCRVQGAIMILSRMKDAGVILCKGKDSKIYSDAMYECLLNPSNMDRYLNEDGVLRFKDHERNSKGKLIKCKAVIE